MGTIARGPAEDDPAAALAAVLGRPFPAIELFDRIADIVFFIKDREARYVAVNQTLADRCNFADKRALIGRKASEVFAPPLGERFEAQDLKVIAEGLSIRGRMELHLYPDGERGLVPDLERAAARRRRRHSRPRRHFSRRAGSVAAGPRPGGALRRARLYRRPSRPAAARSRSRRARRPVAVPVRPEASGPVRPLGWPISRAAAHRPRVRPAPARRGAVERAGARMRLCRPGGVHAPVP